MLRECDLVMLALIAYFEVGVGIVQSVAVNVMHMFVALQGASEQPLSDYSMLPSPTAIVAFNDPIMLLALSCVRHKPSSRCRPAWIISPAHLFGELLSFLRIGPAFAQPFGDRAFPIGVAGLSEPGAKMVAKASRSSRLLVLPFVVHQRLL